VNHSNGVKGSAAVSDSTIRPERTRFGIVQIVWFPRAHINWTSVNDPSRMLWISATETIALSGAPISFTYWFQTSTIRCSGISVTGLRTDSYSARATR
jgi:hypothetical protein